MRGAKGVLIALAMTILVAAPAWAEPKSENFWGTWEGENEFLCGGGTGWDMGAWLYYDQTEWWNQWFYDDPPDPTRWKEIDYSVQVYAMPDPGYLFSLVDVQIALNWSALGFPETGPGGQPPMPDQEGYVRRAVVGEIVLAGQFQDEIFGHFEIPDYNPEWVSIDVQVTGVQSNGGTGQWVPMSVDVSGTLVHECVPEPTTLALLTLGGLALIRRRRR